MQNEKLASARTAEGAGGEEGARARDLHPATWNLESKIGLQAKCPRAQPEGNEAPERKESFGVFAGWNGGEKQKHGAENEKADKTNQNARTITRSKRQENHVFGGSGETAGKQRKQSQPEDEKSPPIEGQSHWVKVADRETAAWSQERVNRRHNALQSQHEAEVKEC